MGYKQITSTNNPLIKELLLFQEKSRARKISGKFIIEGLREIKLAIGGSYLIDRILYCPEFIDDAALVELNSPDLEFIEISKVVYEKLAYRNSTEGIIAIASMRDLSLDTLKLESQNPLILVAEAPEKPGNIGALLRTADAANLDAVLIANPKTDLYNPNVIRSSVGCIFTNQIATGSTSEIIKFLKDRNIRIFGAALQSSESYSLQDYTGASAIIVGTESTGLSQEWLDEAAQNIRIPMQGQIDSMNVSVAAGILIFEAKRQRDFK